MIRRFALILLVLTVLVAGAACGSKKPLPQPAPTPGEATGLDGAKILSEKCDGVCHSLDRVNAQKLDAVGWAAVIDQMVARGADVSNDEAAALAEYLAMR